MKCFIGSNMFISSLGYSRIKMYQQKNTRVSTITNSISRDCFLVIRKFFKVVSTKVVVLHLIRANVGIIKKTIMEVPIPQIVKNYNDLWVRSIFAIVMYMIFYRMKTKTNKSVPSYSPGSPFFSLLFIYLVSFLYSYKKKYIILLFIKIDASTILT